MGFCFSAFNMAARIPSPFPLLGHLGGKPQVLRPCPRGVPPPFPLWLRLLAPAPVSLSPALAAGPRWQPHTAGRRWCPAALGGPRRRPWWVNTAAFFSSLVGPASVARAPSAGIYGLPLCAPRGRFQLLVLIAPGPSSAGASGRNDETSFSSDFWSLSEESWSHSVATHILSSRCSEVKTFHAECSRQGEHRIWDGLQRALSTET
ncbi:uncharacterized protein LOC128314669 isoform X2 [Acinonyx jubatus]|uniref:Uncharacterized protein LOC128314669 isoform X2 n=1 Tax=Acinonyx jubatus TaxID=32536 RepID=A0ABM3PQ34_ACIJB|nr:uncharacterized protein LOC128314669 isoform X2 [Acinonyx jubatus]